MVLGRALLYAVVAVALLSVLAAGAGPISVDGAWLDALESRDRGALAALLEDGYQRVDAPTAKGKTALMLAAQAADRALSLALLAAGAKANTRNHNGGTPLMHAAVGGDAAIVQVLLAAGSEVNAVAGTGWAALTLAAVKDHAGILTIPLTAGAQPNLPDIYGWTPLMRAVEQKRLAAVRTLAAATGIDLDAHNDDGVTALHRAAALGFVEIVRALIKAGADRTVLDQRGRTPLDYAREAGHRELLPVLSG